MRCGCAFSGWVCSSVIVVLAPVGTFVGGLVGRIIVIVRIGLILIGNFLQLFYRRLLLQALHFSIERRLQFIRGTAEFSQGFSYGSTQLRQFFRTEEDQREEEDEDRFRPTQRTHRFISSRFKRL